MRIVFYGDSITDAGRNRDKDFHHSSYGAGYVRDVASDLLNQNPLGFEIINRGISGNRIVDLYARIKTDLWNLNPDIISILIGVNDVWHEIGSKNGVELDRFERVYRMLIEDTKKVLPNAKIVILEPFVLKGIAPFLCARAISLPCGSAMQRPRSATIAPLPPKMRSLPL